MKIEKARKELYLRIKIADGSVGKEQFVVSLLANGSGLLVEFDNDKYLIRTEELVKEVIRKRADKGKKKRRKV